jgi:hypothetical protein
MDDLRQQAAQDLRAVIEKYSAGEAEVVRAYFAWEHTDDDHIEVLLKQMGREIQGRQGIADVVGPMARELERGVDRRDYVAYLRHTAEEAEHYALLANIAEWLAGGKLDPDRLLGSEVIPHDALGVDPTVPANPRLPEASRNANVGKEIIASLGAERGRALLHLAEGGGGGAFVECAKLQGTEFKDRLGAAMRKIAHDEFDHGPGRVDGYVRQWITSPDQIAIDCQALGAFMLAHLRVRNEIWNYPLSEERILQIERGEGSPTA